MSIRKTSRKNKTKQAISWPSHDTHFTINDLVKLNSHMLTSAPKPSDITLRVRLNKAINEENLVSVIGQKNCGKGRPQLVFSMRPIKQSSIDKAKADGISLDMTRIMNVMEISPQSPMSNVTTVTNITANSTTTVHA
jgi:hypothetical protein